MSLKAKVRRASSPALAASPYSDIALRLALDVQGLAQLPPTRRVRHELGARSKALAFVSQIMGG